MGWQSAQEARCSSDLKHELLTEELRSSVICLLLNYVHGVYVCEFTHMHVDIHVCIYVRVCTYAYTIGLYCRMLNM